MYLLDTVVVSELRKGPNRAASGVVAWNEGVPAEETFLSVVTVRELRTGALLVSRRDPASGAALEEWVDGVVEAYGQRILPVDIAVAEICAGLHVPDPRPAEDAWLAATALVYGLTIVTRNTRDYSGTGAALRNPWRSPT